MKSVSPWSLHRLLLAVVIGWLFLTPRISVHAAPAPATGSITGRVSSLAAGSYLGNASVKVQGTTLETFTDALGEYRLSNVPAGNVTLRVSYSDMESQLESVTVVPGGTVQKDFSLLLSSRALVPSANEVQKLDTFTVSERAMSAQASGVQQQKTAANIMNVVTFEEFGDLGEGNPGEFLKFVPGIEVNLAPVVASNASIRGMPSDGTLLLYDGMQMANSSADVRGVSMISTNVGNIDRIEVTKVPTPDLPANAVGGSINIRSKSNFSLSRREFAYNVFGNLSTFDSLRNLGSQFTRRLGPDYRGQNGRLAQSGFNLSLMVPVNKSLGLSFGAGYSNRLEPRDSIYETWDLVRGVQTSNQKNPVVSRRQRRFLSGSADYRIGRNHRLSVGMQYSADSAFTFLPLYTTNFGAGAMGGADFTQGAATAVGSIVQQVGGYNQMRQNENGFLNYYYTGDVWKATVGVGISHAYFNTKTLEDNMFRTITAQRTGMVLRGANFSRTSFQVPPSLMAQTASGTPIDPADVRQFTLTTATGGTIPLWDRAKNFKADIGRDLKGRIPVTLRVGVDVNQSNRDIRNQTWSWNFVAPAANNGRLVGTYDLVDALFSKNWVFKDGNTVQWMDRQKVYGLFKAHPEYFQLNEAGAYTSGVNGSKQFTEEISAGFLRADARLFNNRLWLVGGVRYERTADEGWGPLNSPDAIYRKDANGNLARDANGRLIRVTTDALATAKLQYKERAVHVKSAYGDFYPSLNSSLSVTPNILMRGAYARTIGRPALSQILPGATVTDLSSASENRVISANNIGLKPWAADNWDLSLEAYNVKGAVASVSLFRKDISNFFTMVSRPVTPGDLDRLGLSNEYAGYDLVTSANSSDAASITGYEWSWKQSLRPFAIIPDWAKGMEFYMNATRLEISGPGAPNFVPFRPRLLNWGATYANRKAIVRVNVTQQGQQKTANLATNSTTPPNSNQYVAFRLIVDASFEYRFHKRLAIYGSARNLFQNPRRTFRSAPTAPSYAQARGNYDIYGTLLTLGIKGTF